MSSYYEKILATGEVKCIDEEIPFEIPQGWEWCKINNIAFVTKLAGFEYTKYIAGNLKTNGIPLFKGKNVQGGKIIYEFEAYIPENLSDELERSQISKKCLLTPYVGTIGNIGLHNKSGKFHLGSNVGKIEILNPASQICILEEFVHIYLLSQYGYAELTKYKKATAQESISIEAIRDVLLPIPPTQEQQKIVDKYYQLETFADEYSKLQGCLDKLNTEIFDKLKKSILQEAIQGKLVPQLEEEGTAKELLEQIKTEKQKLVKEGKLKKSALNDSVIFRGDDNKYYEQIGKKCVDITEQIPFEIPNSWTWARMGQIGDWGSGSTPQRGNQDYYGGNILWLKTGELNNGIVYDTEEKITQRAFQECSLRMNKIGDVLIAMYGATIGKLAIVGKELTTNQACCGCTPYVVFNWYLFYFLMASRDTFIKKGEGEAQPNISRVKLVEYLIPLPPLKEQQRIVAQIEKLFEQLH